MTLFTIAIILILIMDPLGNVTSYLTMVQGIQPRRQRYIVMREMLIALALMILFNYIGEFLLYLLDISEVTVRLTSGLILFLVALKILFPSTDSLRANIVPGEPFVIPLAIPLIAGPALLATIMLFAHSEPSQLVMLGAILIAWLGAVIILLAAPFLKRTLGNNGLTACERLLALVLVMLAIQRFLEGIEQFIHTPR